MQTSLTPKLTTTTTTTPSQTMGIAAGNGGCVREVRLVLPGQKPDAFEPCGAGALDGEKMGGVMKRFPGGPSKVALPASAQSLPGHTNAALRGSLHGDFGRKAQHAVAALLTSNGFQALGRAAQQKVMMSIQTPRTEAQTPDACGVAIAKSAIELNAFLRSTTMRSAAMPEQRTALVAAYAEQAALKNLGR